MPNHKHGNDYVTSRLMAHLLKNKGKVVSTKELVEAVYGDDPDGGPLTAEHTIRIAVFKLRKKAAQIYSIQGYMVP